MFEYIKNLLENHIRKELPPDGLTPAAVLVPLFSKNGKTHLLMSRRTDSVHKHKRQISFPGGVRDPEDRKMVDTALREAEEEVGLAPNDVVILGLLDDIQTVTDYLVTPVVAEIPYPYDFIPNPSEVEQLLEVPWIVFSDPKDHRRETVTRQGRLTEIDYYSFENQIIWGATARITRQLVELVADPKQDPKELRQCMS